MWIWLALGSAVLLGLYDVAKKKALEKNSVLYVLLVATAFSTLILSPNLFRYPGCGNDHLCLVMKAVMVTASWISGMVGLKMLPITTVSTLKTSRPFLVVIFSIILFGEHLNAWQWGGVASALAGVTLLSLSSRKEGIVFSRNKGIWAMALSIACGVASALFDKFIMRQMEPLFVQSWSNLYITLMLAVCLLYKNAHDGERRRHFQWDWTLVTISLLITCADALYFFSLSEEGALLSVISLVRRASVIITFAVGAVFFKEKNIRSKAFDLMFLLAGMIMLLLGS